jgi:hypothetical protein
MEHSHERERGGGRRERVIVSGLLLEATHEEVKVVEAGDTIITQLPRVRSQTFGRRSGPKLDCVFS